MDKDTRNRWIRWAASIGAFFSAWELLGRMADIFVVAPATVVLARLGQMIASGEIVEPTVATLGIAGTGFVIATVLGVMTGVLVGLSRRAAEVLDPVINGAYATPMSMLIPVLGIYFGLEFRGKVFLVVVFSVFVIIINTAAGIRQVPPPLVEAARSFGVSKRGMYTKVLAPSASPYILTGLRIGLGRAVQGAIVAELLLRVDNLGQFLIEAAGTFDIPTLLAATFFVTMLAAIAMLGARILEWRLLRWRRA